MDQDMNTPQNTPEKEGDGQSRREKRLEKKLRRRQLRRDIREKKRELRRSRSLPGRIGHGLGCVLKLLFVLALVVTVLRVNYKEMGAAAKFVQLLSQVPTRDAADVTQEELLEAAPMDEERGAKIDSSAPIGEDETWAIYVYMVGSDLESSKTNQLSDVAQYLVGEEAAALRDERNKRNVEGMSRMIDTILENDLDLPNSMYTKRVSGAPLQEMLSQLDQESMNQIQSMMGDYRAASTDLEEMMAVELPENVQMVIQPGGAESWGSNLVNPNKTQRFLYDSKGMHKIYEGHISNMGAPETLADFLTFCQEEYPADHTMVLFWNHGGAAFGYGHDAVYLNDGLSLDELRQAFETAYKLNEKDPPVDVIGFDACLMASMEVAEALHGAGRYLVASEEVEPGEGWNYTTWLTAVAENPRMNPQQMARAAADSYMDHYGREAVVSGSGMELFSVLDLSYADDLYDAYSDFAAAALRESVDYAGTAASLGRAANGSIKFAVDYMDVYNTVDLGLFMGGVEGELSKDAEKVLAILDDMVLYNRCGRDVADSTGITVYYPATVKDLSGLYQAVTYIDQICRDDDIRALYHYKVAGCITEEMQEYLDEQGLGTLAPMDVKPLQEMQSEDFALQEDGSFSLAFPKAASTITQEYRYNLLQQREDGSYLHLGYDDYLAEAGGRLQADYDSKWARIDGELLPTRIVRSDGDVLRYSARVYYNGVEANLLLSYDVESDRNTLLGIQPVTVSSGNDILVDRKTETLKPGDTLIPIYEIYDIRTGLGEVVAGKKIVYREDTEVLDEIIPDGSYMSYVSLVDARGDVYDMRPLSFEVKKGVISNPETMELN